MVDNATLRNKHTGYQFSKCICRASTCGYCGGDSGHSVKVSTKTRFLGIKMLFLVVLGILYPFPGVASQECTEPTFNYTVMLIKVGSEERTIRVEDCVQPGKFSETITELRGYDPINHLRRGAFSNMLFLTRISLSRNCIQTLSPGAFTRLPALSSIDLDRNRLERIPVNVFNNLKLSMLRLDYNDIKTIDRFAFGNLSRLEQIDLSGNQLDTFNSEWFNGAEELGALYLAQNRIRTVTASAFQGLPKLLLISLKSNQISHIEPNAFEGLSILETLDLSNNRLSVIQPDVFPDDISIESLYLNSNKLGFLSTSLLSKLSLDYVYLEENPWQCPCMERIITWIRKNYVTLSIDEMSRYKNNPVCVFRNTNADKCTDEVDEESATLYFNSIDPVKPIQPPTREQICR